MRTTRCNEYTRACDAAQHGHGTLQLTTPVSGACSAERRHSVWLSRPSLVAPRLCSSLCLHLRFDSHWHPTPCLFAWSSRLCAAAACSAGERVSACVTLRLVHVKTGRASPRFGSCSMHHTVQPPVQKLFKINRGQGAAGRARLVRLPPGQCYLAQGKQISCHWVRQLAAAAPLKCLNAVLRCRCASKIVVHRKGIYLCISYRLDPAGPD